jgi:CheY-like chemotaxis protein
MPEMDGLAATKQIREQEAFTRSHMPIVAMTAHALKDDCQRCLDAGMDGYVSKPINAKDLREAIQNSLHKKART